MLNTFGDCISFLLDEVPDFLSSEPMIYFVGIFMAFFVLKIFISLINIRR